MCVLLVRETYSSLRAKLVGRHAVQDLVTPEFMSQVIDNLVQNRLATPQQATILRTLDASGLSIRDSPEGAAVVEAINSNVSNSTDFITVDIKLFATIMIVYDVARINSAGTDTYFREALQQVCTFPFN